MQLSTEHAGDVGVVLLRGDLDAITAPKLEETATQMLGDGARSLVLDCQHVTFIDSAGLRAMIDAHNRALAEGGTVTVRRPTAITFRLLQITALDTVLVVEDPPAVD